MLEHILKELNKIQILEEKIKPIIIFNLQPNEKRKLFLELNETLSKVYQELDKGIEAEVDEEIASMQPQFEKYDDLVRTYLNTDKFEYVHQLHTEFHTKNSREQLEKKTNGFRLKEIYNFKEVNFSDHMIEMKKYHDLEKIIDLNNLSLYHSQNSHHHTLSNNEKEFLKIHESLGELRSQKSLIIFFEKFDADLEHFLEYKCCIKDLSWYFITTTLSRAAFDKTANYWIKEYVYGCDPLIIE
jgi:hypothetical protein